MVVLPDEARDSAAEFLESASAKVRGISGGRLRLLWAFTENLGDWSLVRKRLGEEMSAREGTVWAGGPPASMEMEQGPPATEGLFEQLAARLRTAETVGYSPEEPGMIVAGGGKHQWPIATAQEGIPLARHVALSETGDEPADVDRVVLGRSALLRTAP